MNPVRIMLLLWACLGCISARANMVIEVSYDQSVPPEAQTAFNALVAAYESVYTTPITVSIRVRFGAATLGASRTFLVGVPYSDWRAALAANAAAHKENTFAAPAVASLPANDPLGQGTVLLRTANARALGFSADPPGIQPDGTISFSNPGAFQYNDVPTPGLYSFSDAAAHELNEVLGVGSSLNGLTDNREIRSDGFAAEDYFRYGGVGARLITTDSTAAVYFSYDGGNTLVAQFNQSATGDRNDWVDQHCAVSLVQNAFACPGAAVPPVTAPETTVMQTLGYDVKAPDPAPDLMQDLLTLLFFHS